MAKVRFNEEVMPQIILRSGSGLFARRESEKEILDKIGVIILGEALHC